MRIHSSLAADLALLTDALDVPSTDVAATLAALMSAATAAVPSYAGLSVRVCSHDSHVELTTVESSQLASIMTSLRVPLETEHPSPHADGESIVLIIYAGRAGALVDMAADLAWLTGHRIDELRLDEDVAGVIHLHPTGSLRQQSTINQAVGVLIGQGRTPSQAREELDVRAARAGIPRHAASVGLLASLPAVPLRGDE